MLRAFQTYSWRYGKSMFIGMLGTCPATTCHALQNATKVLPVKTLVWKESVIRSYAEDPRGAPPGRKSVATDGAYLNVFLGNVVWFYRSPYQLVPKRKRRFPDPKHLSLSRRGRSIDMSEARKQLAHLSHLTPPKSERHFRCMLIS